VASSRASSDFFAVDVERHGAERIGLRHNSATPSS
jgi:hypothetical protein